MLGKKVIKFERLKISQILHVDKTGFHRLGHIYNNKLKIIMCLIH